MIFESVRNYHEAAVFQEIRDQAPHFPILAVDGGLLADVACVALNRIAPRYIRNGVDMAFYLDTAEAAKHESAVKAAVQFAFDFVNSRAAATSR